MSNKLFIGGLSWDTTNESLQKAFEQYGEIVDLKIITDRETGRSRGFGFITYADSQAIKSAISEMDGAELDGRSIKVNEAEERKPREGGGGYGGGHGGGGGGGGRNKGNNRNRY